MHQPADPPRSRHRWQRVRHACYAALLVAGVTGAQSLRSTPAGDFAGVLDLAQSGQTDRTVYRYRGAYLALYPASGYALTLHTQGFSGYHGARFLVISRIDGLLLGELFTPADTAEESGHEVLRGAELTAFLDANGLSAAPLDALSVARFPARAAK